MNIERIVLAFSGLLVITGLLLGIFVNPLWFIVTAFAGLNVLQAAFTGFCPLAYTLKKSGFGSGPVFH